jgi:putative transposon-encoded protein
LDETAPVDSVSVATVSPSLLNISVSDTTTPSDLDSESVYPQIYFRGIASSGGEFTADADHLPGTYDTDYHYDSADSFNYLGSRGHKIIRLPIRWERIQPTRNAALDSTELTRITTVISNIQSAGMKAIIDVHNYARYINSTANGGAELALGNDLPTADLVDLWDRLSTAFSGNAGVYAYGLMNEPHDIDPNPGVFSGDVRYDWDDGTVQGWTGDSATASNVSNRLRLSASATAGYFNFRKDDAATMRGSGSGSVIQVKATLAAGVSGTWTVKPQWQNSSYQWKDADTVYYQKTSDNTFVDNLIADTEILVTAVFTTNPISSPIAFCLQTEANDAIEETVTVDYDDFSQGSLSGSQTGSEVWESISQTLVNTIRENGDNTLIMVPGYDWSGAQDWTTNHSDGFITDPANNFMYEAHYYFDSDNSGAYNDSYSTTNSAAVTAGYDDLADRVTTELNVWLNWLSSNHVRGFLGEFGWRNDESTSSWNAVGEVLYDLIDAANVSATYWATGEWWGTGYKLSAYTGTPLNTPTSIAPIIEAHLSYSMMIVGDSTAPTDSATVTLSAGITSYDISVSDTTNPSDEVLVSIPKNYVSVLDSSTPSDSATVQIPKLYVSVSDTTTPTDSVAVSLRLSTSVVDSTAPTDTVTVHRSPPWYFADVLTVQVGSIDSGTVETTWDNDGSSLTLAEVLAANPAYTYEFTFNNVPSDEIGQLHKIHIQGNYNGNPAHTVNVEQYNYTTTGWTNVGTLPSTSTSTFYDYDLTSTADYISGNQMKIRFNHVGIGVNTHKLYLDYLKIDTGIDISVSDTTTPTDSVAVSIPKNYISVSDTTTPTDSVTVSIPKNYISVSDTTTPTDSVSVLIPTLLISVSDTSEPTDSVAMSVPTGINTSVTDSTTPTDTVTISIPKNYISVSDSSTPTDVVDIAVRPLYISVTDSTAPTDLPTVLPWRWYDVADPSGSWSDTSGVSTSWSDSSNPSSSWTGSSSTTTTWSNSSDPTTSWS